MRARFTAASTSGCRRPARPNPAASAAVPAALARRDFLKFGVAGLGGLAAAPYVGAALAQARTVNIVGAAATTGAALQEIMRAEGFFKKFGLEPNIVSVADGSKLMGAVIGGSSDIVVISGFSQVLAAIEKGAKIKLVAATRFLVDDVIYSKRPEIRRLKDLEGRTFGTGSPGALLHHMTVALMRKKGVDAAKVRFVNIGSSTDVFRAVVAGTVDGGIALNDVYGQQEHYGVHALDDGLVYDELPEYTYQASYSSDRAITGKRDLLVRTLAAYGTLYRFICGPDSKEAFVRARIAVTSNAAAAAEATTEWEFVQKHKPYAVDLVLSEQRVRYMQQINLELGLQKRMLPYEQVADMSLAQDALKLMG
jgi:ABC-type nitrate/sulfonate/bicarbonate transport system substrate-binding protein